jgi:REP element-mobilizing transposase RayT
MPRRLHHAAGGYVYHALNRAVGRFTLFPRATDFNAFIRVLTEANERTFMRLLAYCVMSNHWHLVLWSIKTAIVGLVLRVMRHNAPAAAIRDLIVDGEKRSRCLHA